MPIVLDTESVSPEARVAYWQDGVAGAFDIAYRAEPLTDAPLRLHLTSYSVGKLSFTEISGQNFRVSRPGCPGRGQTFLLAQIEGMCTVRRDGGEVRLEPGTLCLCRLEEQAEFEMRGAVRYLLVGVPETRLVSHCPEWQRLLSAPICCGGGEAAMFLDSLKSLWQHHSILESARAKWIADGLVNLLGSVLAACAEARHPQASRMEVFHKERIRTFVQAQLSNSELDIPLISRSIGLSPRYIHRLFANEPLHLMQWVWAQRLEHCYRDLVADGGNRRSIGDIAFSWGFNDPAHFSRVFRKHFGMTPREVRAAARQPVAQELAVA